MGRESADGNRIVLESLAHRHAFSYIRDSKVCLRNKTIS